MQKRSIILGLFVALLIMVFDQWSKWYVFDYLDRLQASYIVMTPFFNLVRVFNYGVSFGMFSDLPAGKWILLTITISITFYLLYWLSQTTTGLISVALGLIIGGAVGNIIDRVRIGAVADFLDFHLYGYHWPAFNVADSAVFIGVMILLWDSLFTKGETK